MTRQKDDGEQVNAGVPFHAMEPGTLGLPIAVILGKPLGILVAAGLALGAGLDLPHRVSWRELIVVGFIAAIGLIPRVDAG